MSLLPEIVRCALAVSAHELAHRLVNGTEPRAPLFEHTLRTTQALLTEASGDHASAADLYGDAARRWHEFENAPERAYALLGYGRCLLALKRPIAGATLREARDQFASIGYKLALTETDTLIAETSSGLA